MVYKLLYGVIWCLSSLPFGIFSVLADITYWVIYRLVRYRRKVVRENLLSCFPDKDIKWIKGVERKFYKYLAMYIFEDLRLTCMSGEELRQRMTYVNIGQCLDLMNRYGGVVIMIPHYANYEWLVGVGLFMDKDDVPVQVYKPMRSKFFDFLFNRIRTRYGGYNVPKHSTIRQLVKLRHQGKRMIVGLITDQWPSGNKYWTDFLGRKTAFIDGAERIARMMKFPVFYSELTKYRKGYCKVEFKLIQEHPDMADEGEITEKFVRCLEQTIYREPAYWLWTHKRWK